MPIAPERPGENVLIDRFPLPSRPGASPSTWHLKPPGLKITETANVRAMPNPGSPNRLGRSSIHAPVVFSRGQRHVQRIEESGRPLQVGCCSCSATAEPVRSEQ
jgi:hypothetical protein